MEEEHRTPTPRVAFLVILGSIFLSIIPQVFVASFFLEPDGETISSFGTKLSLFVGEIGLVIVPLIYLYQRNYSIPHIFRWRKVPKNIMWLSIPVGLGLSILLDELDRLFQMFLPLPEELAQAMSKAMQFNSPAELLIIFISAVLLAAIVEESIFRGFLQGAIEEHLNVTQAVIYASLAWAIIHFIPHIIIQIFLFGFILGYLTWRSDSIVPAAICHAVNNTLAVIYFNTDFSETFSFYEWKGHVSPILLVASIWIVYKGIRYFDDFYRALNASSSKTDSSS